MSQHAAFRRQPVAQQFEQQLRTLALPAPTRGIIQNENEAYMAPGGAIVQDNWMPTLTGCKLRGGTVRYCDLHALDYPGSVVWANNTAYTTTTKAYDGVSGTFWQCGVNHTSAATGTFAADRAAHQGPPAYWTALPLTRLPVISAFEYQYGNTQKMFAGQATKLFDVTTTTPVLVKSGQTSGNYVGAQLANAAVSPTGTNWLLACNDTGDYVLRFNGSTWTVLDGTPPANWVNNFAYAVGARAFDTADSTRWKVAIAHTSAAAGTFAADRTAHPTYWVADMAGDGASWITGPAGSTVANGAGLSYVWKYRNRLFFIEAGSMNAWYFTNINAVGGTLLQLPLAGAATKGGKLLWGATWSLDAGDGIDEKCIFVTDQGEVLIFTGTNPSDAANWKQEGRYSLSPPLGMNGHIQVGGDMLILTVDGIIPLSQAITKSAGELDLAMLTRTIERMWHAEVAAKRAWAWTIEKWDEFSGLFVTTPGSMPADGLNLPRHCLVAHNTTGAWCRFGYDATCFIKMRADLFFGTEDGLIMQAERTGYDDGKPYVATLVGGWEMFGAPANEIVWHQARVSFRALVGEPFQPQVTAMVNYEVTIPPPPPIGPDPGISEVWDQGLWDHARWDVGITPAPPVSNTMWVSIGMTGFAHAPIVQIQVGQSAVPSVEMLAIAAVYEPAGVNV